MNAFATRSHSHEVRCVERLGDALVTDIRMERRYTNDHRSLVAPPRVIGLHGIFGL